MIYSFNSRREIYRFLASSFSDALVTLRLLFFSQNSCGAPVDKLLFLTSRAQWRTQESAVLVSSEAGTLEFWCFYGANRPMGMYLNI